MTHSPLVPVLAWLVAVSAMACRFDFEPVAAAVDGAPDPSVDGPPGACWDWTPRHIDPCTLAQSMGDLVLSPGGEYRYDTDAGVLLDPEGSPVAHSASVMGGYQVVSADRFELPADAVLRPHGTRPLIIAAAGEITIAGTINVDSRLLFDAGAGTQPAHCGDGAPTDGENDGGGAGGGGGGAYQGDGGRGGDGDNNGGMSLGGAAGVRRDVPAQVAGGCAGGDGGIGYGGVRGLGGDGGGAVELVSQTSIRVSGVINAGGGGGTGGSEFGDGGGGGGGSGGYIGLDAREINLESAVVVANGGGGGEGAGDPPGNDGEDGGLTTARAAGGFGSASSGADGGEGGSQLSLDGDQPTMFTAGGGGGGGGGVGYILVFTDVIQAWPEVESPALIVTYSL